MLPANNRLSSGSEIKRLVKSGHSLRGAHLTVYYQASGKPTSRIAFIVSKTVHRSAVVRNRLRRWLSAIGQESLGILVDSGSYDMVWIAHPSITKIASQREFRDALLPRIKKLAKNKTP
ncbi:ribonuclease P protein component [Patescibacteria group bacterium]|nr:ribonuclease P protein component [Patescibacteria group bacterium]